GRGRRCRTGGGRPARWRTGDALSAYRRVDGGVRPRSRAGIRVHPGHPSRRLHARRATELTLPMNRPRTTRSVLATWKEDDDDSFTRDRTTTLGTSQPRGGTRAA